jgi:hypothetical protein
MRDDENFVPGPISPNIDAASEALFPKELKNKPLNQMAPDELFEFMNALLGFPNLRSKMESDRPENKEFMEFVADEQERLGNNGEPIRPEDCDLDEVPFEK